MGAGVWNPVSFSNYQNMQQSGNKKAYIMYPYPLTEPYQYDIGSGAGNVYARYLGLSYLSKSGKNKFGLNTISSTQKNTIANPAVEYSSYTEQVMYKYDYHHPITFQKYFLYYERNWKIIQKETSNYQFNSFFKAGASLEHDYFYTYFRPLSDKKADGIFSENYSPIEHRGKYNGLSLLGYIALESSIKIKGKHTLGIELQLYYGKGKSNATMGHLTLFSYQTFHFSYLNSYEFKGVNILYRLQYKLNYQYKLSDSFNIGLGYQAASTFLSPQSLQIRQGGSTFSNSEPGGYAKSVGTNAFYTLEFIKKL